ncbi:UDP-glycosyltransferase 708G1-like [Malania oleifera]|uniref:UDP-glycosyltransferase 708G1-like n=1 Tax=Malania oleifera TaxID=397392 RepID=UPI0025ADF404|nr:UDP-glycosyltransferase 708G1-like [Malania oleifera]
MSYSSSSKSAPHVALLPGSGMGHLTPFLRLATSLAALDAQVTIITTHPTVSDAESQALSCLFSTFPLISERQLHLLPLDNPSAAKLEDLFYLKFEAIRRSSHHLSPLLSSISPPLSALITDMSLASTVIPITKAHGLPNYILFTPSAKMLTLFASFHKIVGSQSMGDDAKNVFNIPGLQPIPRSWVPPPLLLNANNLLKTLITENGKSLIQSDGILINTFESFEQESLAALNDGSIVNRLPLVIAVGPLVPNDFQSGNSLAWLNRQPSGSVVYVSFGSRTAMSRGQIRELGEGLVKSGCRFVWVVKDKKVDREDEAQLNEVVGHELMEKAKENGLVVKNWVRQEDILGHAAVGGFFSHCGWNSVIEAAWHGVPMLAWPQHGDQKMNASVVESTGLGMWLKSWDWGGGLGVVQGEEIGEAVREMMGNKLLREQALQIREKARTAVGANGSSKKALAQLIEKWKKKHTV